MKITLNAWQRHENIKYESNNGRNLPCTDSFSYKKLSSDNSYNCYYQPIFCGTIPDKKFLKQLAENIYETNSQKYDTNFELIKSILPLENGTLIGRVKKLPVIKESLEYLKCKYSQGEMNQYANQLIPDATGFRFIINNGSEEEMDSVVDAIKQACDEGIIFPGYFFNHGDRPYCNTKHCEIFNEIGFKSPATKRNNGYTALNMYFYNQDGQKLELQIMGPKIAELAKAEHPFINFFERGKATKQEKIIPNLDAALRKLDQNQILQLREYIRQCYHYTRMLELGIIEKRPSLPGNFEKILELV